MSGKSSSVSRLAAVAILAAGSAAVVLAIYLLRVDHRPELLTLDRRFRAFGGIPEEAGVVHVDIDDAGLEQHGRWPWPRESLAGMIDVLNRAGARRVALDIIFPEPQERRFVSAASEVYAVGASVTVGQDAPRPVFDDAILRRQISEAANVFIPMHIRPGDDEYDATEARIAALYEGGARSFQAVLAGMAAGAAAQPTPEKTAQLAKAYLRVRGLEAMRRFAVPSEACDGAPVIAGRIAPPLATIAQVCYGSGFVTFAPDDDGVVRRIPLLAGSADRVYPQFALAIAADQLAVSHGGSYRLTAQPGRVILHFADGFERRIPIDRDGRMLINWSSVGGADLAKRHVSAGRVVALSEMSAGLKRNQVRKRLLLFDLLGMQKQWYSPAASDRYYELARLDGQLSDVYQRRIAAQLDVLRAMLYDPDNVPPAPDDLLAREEELEGRIDGTCAAFVAELTQPANLRTFLTGPSSDGATPGQTGDADLSRARGLLKQIDLASAANAQMREDLNRRIGDLRATAAGRTCLVGSIATGAADFVPTPIDGRMPGSWVHANILNTIFSGRFIRPAPRALAVAVVVLAALAMGTIAGWMSMLKAAPAAIALAGGYVLFDGYVVFAGARMWMPLVAPLAAMVLAFVSVTAYRQITEERAKRRIRGMFAHALSPALVDRLMEDPSLARLGGERRKLTFFFSDLQGFTPISERLGEENTVALLNRYFDRMTDVIQNRRGGYLNKFLGDGLFVFFGAPVFQDDHPGRAIRAALDCQREVDVLNDSLPPELLQAGRIVMRIGLSTGEVMVGNCGSSQRMDYTAIGDPVNLASRLESANKFFGTRILVEDETWRLGGDDSIPARPLGRITVVGRDQPVSVWNLAAPDGAGDELRHAFARFAEGIDLFSAGRFAEAEGTFSAVLAEMPGDPATEAFLGLCRKHQADPPGDEWDGVLRLAEK
jgi:adenylate cyclase